MPHCYQCDRLVADLSSRSRCVDCECNRSKANEAENEQLREQIAELVDRLEAAARVLVAKAEVME